MPRRRAALLHQYRPVLQCADAHAGATRDQQDEAIAHRRRSGRAGAGSAIRSIPRPTMGPLVSKSQFDKVQGLIERGIEEGATLVSGGPGRPTASIAAISSVRRCLRTSRPT